MQTPLQRALSSWKPTGPLVFPLQFGIVAPSKSCSSLPVGSGGYTQRNSHWILMIVSPVLWPAPHNTLKHLNLRFVTKHLVSIFCHLCLLEFTCWTKAIMFSWGCVVRESPKARREKLQSCLTRSVSFILHWRPAGKRPLCSISGPTQSGHHCTLALLWAGNTCLPYTCVQQGRENQCGNSIGAPMCNSV